MKKKRIIILLSVLLVVTLCLVGIFLVHKFQEEEKKKKEMEMVSKIRESFSEGVKTTKRKKIYQKKKDKYQEVGFVDKETFLPLEKAKINTSSDIYFKIKDLDYYIDYENLEKASHTEDNSLSHLIPTKRLVTDKTELYKNNQLVISLPSSFTFDVLLIEEGNYYISFLGEIYSVREQFQLEEKETEPLLQKLSVFQFSEDIKEEKLEEILSLWKEKEYTTLTKQEFIYWTEGKGDFREKSIFLVGSDSQKEKWNDILQKYNFSLESNLDPFYFHEGDQQLTKGASKHYHYLVSNSTTKERVVEMLSGISKPTPTPIPRTSSSGVAVLNYHFFYDAATEGCNESICISTENFRKQLDYLKNNGYKTLTMQEFYDWKMGNITIPEKSVLLTIDDGAMGTDTHLPAILAEYQMHASLFLITGWWEISKYQKTPYLEIYSHGDELHHNNYCVGSNCGFKPLLLSKDEIVADLNLSLSKGVGKLAFCYPFYKTSQTLEAALREVGIPLAFAGGNRKATRSVSNYYIPRYVVYKGTSLSQFINMIS